MLEVMVSLAILIMSLSILMQTQATAVMMTEEAQHMLAATQLAQEKMAEVSFLVENEGFQTEDVYEEGEFDDFGDEAMDIEFEDLEEYHYEYLVTEIDLTQAGDLAATMQNLAGDMVGQATDGQSSTPPDLSGLPISGDMIAEMLSPFIREVRVRVWWGEDSEQAEEEGNEVVITTHMINPHGNMLGSLGALGGMGGQQGGKGGGKGGNNPFGNPMSSGDNPFGGMTAPGANPAGPASQGGGRPGGGRGGRGGGGR